MKINPDSRTIEPGDTFIAIKGLLRDGHDFIETAIKNGATTIICEHGDYDVETIHVDNAWEYYTNYLKENIYPEIKDIKLVGITGTTGKTTTAYLAYELLNKLGMKTAYIGTLGFYINNEIIRHNNITNPELHIVYDMLLRCKREGIETVIMEASSAGLLYGRLDTLEFDMACFTNLSHEHMETHGNMENYKEAKQLLFKMLRKDKIAIVNADNEYGRDFIFDDNNNITLGEKNASCLIKDYVLNTDGSDVKFSFDNKDYELTTTMPGKYNIYNYLMSFLIALKFNFDSVNIIKAIRKLTTPPGRMQTVKYKSNIIIIDFAHSPDAVEKILETTKVIPHNKIYTVIGCPGNRDRTKRPMMASIAIKYSNHAIFTLDNPATEDHDQIFNDMTDSLENTNYEVIEDRDEAIKKAISLLTENDILMLLGKGDELYQIIGTEKIPYSDLETVNKYID